MIILKGGTKRVMSVGNKFKNYLRKLDLLSSMDIKLSLDAKLKSKTQLCRIY